MSDLTKCGKCGSPILGNETFCSNCGQRLHGSSGLTTILWIFGVLAVLGIAAGAGVYVAGRRVLKVVESRVPGGGAARGSLRRVVRSLDTRDKESHRSRDFGCSLLSKEDASAIAGTAVTRLESTADACAYFGVPDPSLNPEAVALKSMPGVNADPQASKMIDQFAAGMRKTVEEKDPDSRAGPGGERLLFSAGSSASLSASMELSQHLATPQTGGETISGLGDQAFFLPGRRMFFVRKGTSYLLVQPQFVADPRGVAIAAAKKILESPNFAKPAAPVAASACDRKLVSAGDVSGILRLPISGTKNIPGDPQTCEFTTSSFPAISVSLRPGLGRTTVETWAAGRMPLKATRLAGVGDSAVWVEDLNEVDAQRNDTLCVVGARATAGDLEIGRAELQKRLGGLCNKIFAGIRP